MKFGVEYLWLGYDYDEIGCNDLIRITRKQFYTKVRTIENDKELLLKDIPEWSFDGSSTGHITTEEDNTDIILKPVKLYKHPFSKIDYLVLCETYNIDGTQHETNDRSKAVKIFNDTKLEPWYGLEQEFVFMEGETNSIYGWNMEYESYDDYPEQGYYYCGTSGEHYKLRKIMEEHYTICLKIGINISGFNAEVMPCQWEFQIGPSEGINAADELIVARFILERLCEEHNMYINYHPKPLDKYNGSGCHHNFSTNETRKYNKDNFEEKYKEIFVKLENNHQNIFDSYGEDNEYRLTGHHETSNMEKFSYGIGTRHTSIRIPINVYTYFEDRRPAASCDPYSSTCALLENVSELSDELDMLEVLD